MKMPIINNVALCDFNNCPWVQDSIYVVMLANKLLNLIIASFNIINYLCSCVIKSYFPCFGLFYARTKMVISHVHNYCLDLVKVAHVFASNLCGTYSLLQAYDDCVILPLQFWESLALCLNLCMECVLLLKNLTICK